jgi:hypothetical protein
VRTMRFAILPLVILRKSQFVPAGNDVLIQVAPFRCTFFVPNDAVQEPSYKHCFLVLGSHCSMWTETSGRSLLIVLLFLFLLAVVLGILRLAHLLSVTTPDAKHLESALSGTP